MVESFAATPWELEAARRRELVKGAFGGATHVPVGAAERTHGRPSVVRRLADLASSVGAGVGTAPAPCEDAAPGRS